MHLGRKVYCQENFSDEFTHVVIRDRRFRTRECEYSLRQQLSLLDLFPNLENFFNDILRGDAGGESFRVGGIGIFAGTAPTGGIENKQEYRQWGFIFAKPFCGSLYPPLGLQKGCTGGWGGSVIKSTISQCTTVDCGIFDFMTG